MATGPWLFGKYKVSRPVYFLEVECSQHKIPMIQSGFNVLRTVTGKVFLILGSFLKIHCQNALWKSTGHHALCTFLSPEKVDQNFGHSSSLNIFSEVFLM